MRGLFSFLSKPHTKLFLHNLVLLGSFAILISIFVYYFIDCPKSATYIVHVRVNFGAIPNISLKNVQKTYKPVMWHLKIETMLNTLNAVKHQVDKLHTSTHSGAEGAAIELYQVAEETYTARNPNCKTQILLKVI